MIDKHIDEALRALGLLEYHCQQGLHPSAKLVRQTLERQRAAPEGWRDLCDDPPGGCINGRAILYWRPTDGAVRMEAVSHAIEGFKRQGYTKWLDITLPEQ